MHRRERNGVLKFVRKFGPLGDQSERAIRAVSKANLGEEDVGPLDDILKHGIDLSFEIGGPPAR